MIAGARNTVAAKFVLFALALARLLLFIDDLSLLSYSNFKTVKVLKNPQDRYPAGN
jgi:hypothetical protein